MQTIGLPGNHEKVAEFLRKTTTNRLNISYRTSQLTNLKLGSLLIKFMDSMTNKGNCHLSEHVFFK